jgi:hypothetical protein
MDMEQNREGRSGAEQGSGNAPFLRERRMFRLLLQGNANYFGTRPDSLLPARTPICCNRYYEEIVCVTWDRKPHSLVAIIALHRSAGYAGGTRMSQTPEHLRFYLSLDGGKSWLDQGHVSVGVENAPAEDDRHYAVSLEPRLTAEELDAGEVRVRAILAWDDLPPAEQPEWKPVFGDVHEALLTVGGPDAAGDTPLLVAGLGGALGSNMLAVVRLTADDLRSRRFRCLSFWAGKEENNRFDYCLGSLALSEGVAEHVVTLPLDLLDCRRVCAESSSLLRVKLVLSAEPAVEGNIAGDGDGAVRVAEACLTIPPEVKAGAGEIALIGGCSAREIHVAELQLDNLEGNEILVQGVPREGCSYVVEVSDDGLEWRPLLKSFAVMDRRGQRIMHRPDESSGHFRYLPHEKNVLGILARWDDPRPGKWRVRLRVYIQGILLPESDQVMVRIGEDACGQAADLAGEGAAVNPSGLPRSLVHGCVFPGAGLVHF